MIVRFSVPGRPLPAGSKDRVPITRNGHTVGHRIIETGNRPAKAAWRADIHIHATLAMEDLDLPPLDGPVRLTAIFHLQRPKGHYGTGRNEHQLRGSAPTHPTTMPDLLKLARGLEDALQGIVYRNDAQIVSEQLVKAYGSPERVEVTVSTIEETQWTAGTP